MTRRRTWEYTEGWPLQLTGREFDDEVTLPAAAPTLPAPIDGLWLASLSALTRVIAWLPGRDDAGGTQWSA